MPWSGSRRATSSTTASYDGGWTPVGYPTIAGRVTNIVIDGSHPDYFVTGEVSFHGKTKTFSHGMRIEVLDDGVSLTGEDVFDIREFGMKPPSMLMVRVYPEISVSVELQGVRDAVTRMQPVEGGPGFGAVTVGWCRWDTSLSPVAA